jgi:hypothetical protein
MACRAATAARRCGLTRVAEGEQAEQTPACPSGRPATRRCGPGLQAKQRSASSTPSGRPAPASSACCPARSRAPCTVARDAAAGEALHALRAAGVAVAASPHRARRAPAGARCRAAARRPVAAAVRLAIAVGRLQRRQRRLAFGERAGLVESDRGDRCASSSASASLIRMPCRAATPVPAMMAAGVARPSAQGQAITSTATALRIAGSQSPPYQAPAGQRQRRQCQHHRHEHGADAVDEPLDRRLGGLRRFRPAE